MTTRRRFVLGLTTVPLCGAVPAPVYEEQCGVRFQVLRHGRGPRRYLFIHGDEFTAFDVLTKHMKSHNGVAYLASGKERNIEIQGMKVDPNRMWSRIGAEKSLRAQNTMVADDKVADILHFLDGQREAIIRKLTPGPGSRLVALHNNRDYSVQDEVASSDAVSIKQPDKPRYFFLCTQPADFEALKKSPYNVVLQTKAEPDDGSLSRLAARRGFRYINLECAIYDEEAQRVRLNWLEKNLT